MPHEIGGRESFAPHEIARGRQTTVTRQLASARVIKKKLASAFPNRGLQRVKRINEQKIKSVTAVTRIRSLDGW
jgi:hypothetical protein